MHVLHHYKLNIFGFGVFIAQNNQTEGVAFISGKHVRVIFHNFLTACAEQLIDYEENSSTGNEKVVVFSQP